MDERINETSNVFFRLIRNELPYDAQYLLCCVNITLLFFITRYWLIFARKYKYLYKLFKKASVQKYIFEIHKAGFFATKRELSIAISLFLSCSLDVYF